MTSKKEKMVPEIRFKGYVDNWEQRKVGEFSEMTYGGGTPKTSNSHFWNGNIPWIQSSDLEEHKLYDVTPKKSITENAIEKSAAKVIPENSIAIVTRVGVGKLAFMPYEYATSQDFLSLSKLKVNQWFAVYSLYKKLQSELSTVQGTSIKGITKAELLDKKLLIPTNFAEQQKIGAFFNSLDDTITLHQQKLTLIQQVKQTLLSLLFPEKEAKIPQLRFANFTEYWEQRKLKSVTERVRGNDGRMNLPTLTISAGSGWLDQRERFSGNIAGKEQKNYTLLHKEELSYNHGNSKLAKYGAVFELRMYEEALVPRVYHSFKTTSESVSDFVEYMFATKRPDRELRKLISSGTRMDGLLNINFDEFMDIKIALPIVDEQKLISKLLRNLDNLITLHQSKINSLSKTKNVLLKKLFI